MTSNRKIISRTELVFVVLAILIISYIILKTSGGSVYERKESVTMTENSPTGSGKKQARNYEMQDEERVEVILQQLSEQFSDGNNNQPESGIDHEDAISDDEMSYFESLRKKYATEEKTSNPADWLAILQASHQTYSKIKSVFEEADPSGKKVKEDNVSKTLRDAAIANIVYAKLEEFFNIPQEDAQKFAQTGKKAISDWAEFVEQNQPKKEK